MTKPKPDASPHSFHASVFWQASSAGSSCIMGETGFRQIQMQPKQVKSAIPKDPATQEKEHEKEAFLVLEPAMISMPNNA